MANVSEDLSQMSAEWMLKALEALSQLGYSTVKLVSDIGRDGASTLVGLLNYLENRPGAEYDFRTRRAISKLRSACEKDDASALQMSVPKKDLAEVEKWLKKQDMLYVACSPENKKKGSPNEELAQLTRDKNKDMSTIFFMEKDKKKIENAVAVQAYKAGLINVLPPEAFFLLYDDKKDISVIDGLDYFELSVFRELAKKYGLGYTEMENGQEQSSDSTPGTYKVVCGKENASKAMAIMRLVSWTMTGDEAPAIKEKVIERQSLTVELEKLMNEGVKAGVQFVVDENAKQVAIENAKYIVNARSPGQFIKLTAKGFYRHNGGEEAEFTSLDDPDYDERLEDALSEYPDYVIFDSVEWEMNGLGKSNLRKDKVAEKLSALPPKLSVEKEEGDIRKAHKKRQEQGRSLEESVWLFHRYDPDNDEPLSEIVEENFNAPSKPLEEVVSVHYNSAVERSKKYKYYDVESNEQTVDKIILAAKEKVAGNIEPEQPKEKDEAQL